MKSYEYRFLPKHRMLLLLPVLLLAFLNSCTEKEKIKPPNIIFIMSDDHANRAISAYGSNLIETPNIDRLAKEGMRFDNAFVTNSICSPSRAVILTGKYSHLNGLWNNIQVFDSAQQTYPKLLHQAGYETAVIGKWHLKSEPTGFDHWMILRDQGDYYQPEFRTAKGLVTKQGYATDVITDLSIDWLSHRDTTKPFLLICQHKAPHREWMPSQNHLGDFMSWDIPEPGSLFDDYENRGTAAKEAEMRIRDNMAWSSDNKIPPDSVDKLGFHEFMDWYKPVYYKNYNRMTDTEKQHWDSVYDPLVAQFMKDTPTGDSLLRWRYQRFMQDYLATIESVDDNVGRLLDYLKKQGLDKNTIVVYTSDQGFYLGEHGWFDKRFMYEESLRTPLIIRWPEEIPAGSVNKNLVLNLDFAETFLDAAGVKVPDDMQGKSMLPIFKTENADWRNAIYYHYYEYPGIHAVKRHYGIRTDRFKLIHFYYDVDEWELYDLQEDPHEMKNVIEEKAYSEVRQQLQEKLDSIKHAYGDSDSLAHSILQAEVGDIKMKD